MVVRTELERERHALLAHGYALVAGELGTVHVEHAHVFNEHPRLCGLDNVYDLLRGGGLVDYEGDIALHGGVLGQGLILPDPCDVAAQSRKVELRDERGRGNAERPEHLRMDRADLAELFAADAHHGLLRGMQVFRTARLEADTLYAELFEESLERSLQGEEILVGAEVDHAEQLPFLGQVAVVEMDVAHLEEPPEARPAVKVERRRAQEPARQFRAHEGLILAEGVHEPDRFPALVALGYHKVLDLLGRDEVVVVKLQTAERRHGVLYGVLVLEALPDSAAERVAAHERRRDVRIAVKAAHLLGDIPVGLKAVLYIRAEMRHAYLQRIAHGLGGDVDGGKQLRHLLGGKVGIEYLVDVRNGRGGLLLGKVGGANVYHAAHDAARVQLLHKLNGACKRKLGVDRLHALYKARGGIGDVVEPPCGGADVFGAEDGAFKQSGLCVFGYLAVETAHNARNAHAFFGVGDEQHIGAHNALFSVEGIDDLAVTRVAHDDMAVGNAGKVKRVHGVTVLDQHEVRYVDYVVDGPQTHGAKLFLQPQGRRLNVEVCYDARRIARAKVGVFNGDGGNIRAVAIALHPLYLRLAETLTQRCRRLAADADDGLAVRAVGGKLYIEHAAVHIKRLLYALAVGVGFRKHHYPAVFTAGIVGVGNAYLLIAAEHARRGHAAHLGGMNDKPARQRRAVKRNGHLVAGLYVGRVGHYLQKLAPPGVHGADAQLIRVGMGLYIRDSADVHAVDAVHFGDDLRHFEPAKQHPFRKLLGSHVEVDVFFKPFKR